MRLRLIVASLFGAALLSGAAGRAAAHNQPFSFVEVRVADRGASGSITAHIADISHDLGLPDPSVLLVEGLAEGFAPDVQRLFAERFRLGGDGTPIALSWTSVQLIPSRELVVFDWIARWERAPRRIEIACALFPYDPQHQTYLNVYEDDRIRVQEICDQARNRIEYVRGGGEGPFAVLRRFVPAGMHHIFIGPDHILFIVGLLLLGGSLKRLIKIITGFTIAHSITLALATLGIVTPPSSIIEPAIAASIVLIGVENLTVGRRGGDRRALLAFAFGLVHGFGFASVLREMGLPRGALGWALIGFNLGVEAGQAAVVLAVAPWLALLRRQRPIAAMRLVSAGSVCVILAGGYWLIQRTFFS